MSGCWCIVLERPLSALPFLLSSLSPPPIVAMATPVSGTSWGQLGSRGFLGLACASQGPNCPPEQLSPLRGWTLISRKERRWDRTFFSTMALKLLQSTQVPQPGFISRDSGAGSGPCNSPEHCSNHTSPHLIPWPPGLASIELYHQAPDRSHQSLEAPGKERPGLRHGPERLDHCPVCSCRPESGELDWTAGPPSVTALPLSIPTSPPWRLSAFAVTVPRC